MSYFRIVVIYSILLISISVSSYAQPRRPLPVRDVGPGNFGIKIGAGLSNYTGEDAKGLNSGEHLSIAIYYTTDALNGDHLEFTQNIGYHINGISYPTYDQSYGYFSVRDKHIYPSYVVIDNILKIKLNAERSTPFFGVGAYLGFMVSGEIDLSNMAGPDKNGFKRYPNSLDYGLLFGFGIDFGAPEHGENERALGIEIYYSRGLSKIFDSYDFSNQVISATFRIYVIHFDF